MNLVREAIFRRLFLAQRPDPVPIGRRRIGGQLLQPLEEDLAGSILGYGLARLGEGGAGLFPGAPAIGGETLGKVLEQTADGRRQVVAPADDLEDMLGLLLAID